MLGLPSAQGHFWGEHVYLKLRFTVMRSSLYIRADFSIWCTKFFVKKFLHPVALQTGRHKKPRKSRKNDKIDEHSLDSYKPGFECWA